MRNHTYGRTESIPVHRVAVLRPFAQFLADVGAPVEREFQRAGLPFFALEYLNNYVPSYLFWSFLVNTARNQAIEDLGFRVGRQYGADSADPKLTSLLHQSPTLYRGILTASDLTNKTITHCRLGLIQSPGSEHAYFYHRPSCDAQNPAIEQIGWFGLMTLLGIVRIFAGPEWHPSEMGLMTPHPPCNSIREEFPGTHMRVSQQFSYIALENALLSLPPITHNAATPASSSVDYERFSNDFVGSFTQVLFTYLQEKDLSVDFAAGLCNTSKRTLQRKLAETGTRYSEVLDHARFHAASRMLQDPNMKVTDVSRLLGYSDPTHFSRTFRRIAGVTPRVYRQAYTR
ncbi:MAG: helix-turn-helix domain-containing protein [Pseudomonadota bacterium]|nr:helix-turn-helix domain-containing protein [Pseudomonadota bacterium]